MRLNLMLGGEVEKIVSKDIIMRIMLAGMIIALAGVPMSSGAWAAISGSEHDFSGESWNPSGELCKVCHTPHNALSTLVPLWNHATTIAAFTLYDSPTLDAADLAQPAGISKACLSCHDGTVALDSFGSNTGTTYLTGDELLGTDLSNDHPISFTYDSTLASTDGDLADPTTVNSGLGSTIQNDLLLNDQLECSSCHDVHDSAGIAKLLVKSNGGSALCLTCHTK